MINISAMKCSFYSIKVIDLKRTAMGYEPCLPAGRFRVTSQAPIMRIILFFGKRKRQMEKDRSGEQGAKPRQLAGFGGVKK